jgi:hypothetical protein
MKRVLSLLFSVLLGCSSGSATNSNPAQGVDEPDVDSNPDVDANPDVEPPTRTYDPAQWHTLEAGPFTLPTGAERYYCYSYTLDEDIAVDEIVLESHPVVHHVVASQTTSPDPDGFFDCDVLFQTNWVPVFVAGTGDASIKMPDGAGHVLPKGTQLTVQLHLLNATTDEVTQTIPLRLHKMEEPPDTPVEVVVFGNMNIALPPNSPSEITNTCTSDSKMKIFSAFPHMHLLGKRMVVESAAPGSEDFSEIFRSDPYDFDNQELVPMDLNISAGDQVRVTCGYDNHLDQTVTFGESTTNEMCFFIGFAVNATHQFAGCIGGTGAGPSDFIPEECGTDPPNDLGLGASCSAGGGECAPGLLCTEDIDQLGGPETCISLGCSAAADCGEGAVCCAIPAAGDVTICLPPSCVMPFCENLP